MVVLHVNYLNTLNKHREASGVEYFNNVYGV